LKDLFNRPFDNLLRLYQGVFKIIFYFLQVVSSFFRIGATQEDRSLQRSNRRAGRGIRDNYRNLFKISSSAGLASLVFDIEEVGSPIHIVLIIKFDNNRTDIVSG
jgi:hypothetical protein